RLHTLGLGFVFDAPGDCNLNIVREFLANWMRKERSNHVKLGGEIINFAPISLNRFHGTPHVDPQPFIIIVMKHRYRDIRHTLCGPNSVSRWTRHQQFGYYVSVPFAHFSREACVWLKIVCACLVPGKHSKGEKGQNFGFGGLLTRFLHEHDIEEEEVDDRPPYDPRGIYIAKTKEPEGINSPVLFVNKHNARIDSMLSHLYGIVGIGFEEPLDDYIAIEDEMARVDSDIESSDDNEEDSEIGEASLAPTDIE
ncbi:hypothetical protein HAX54_024463, partial [Datura stramonium]|nr:hypothetical protein [Datura stramonium]